MSETKYLEAWRAQIVGVRPGRSRIISPRRAIDLYAKHRNWGVVARIMGFQRQSVCFAVHEFRYGLRTANGRRMRHAK